MYQFKNIYRKCNFVFVVQVDFLSKFFRGSVELLTRNQRKPRQFFFQNDIIHVSATATTQAPKTRDARDAPRARVQQRGRQPTTSAKPAAPVDIMHCESNLLGESSNGAVKRLIVRMLLMDGRVLVLRNGLRHRKAAAQSPVPAVGTAPNSRTRCSGAWKLRHGSGRAREGQLSPLRARQGPDAPPPRASLQCVGS